MIVKELIRYDCPIAKPEHCVSEVLDMMYDYKISQIPYIDGTDYMALLDEEQIDEMNSDMALKEQVRNIFFNPFISENQHIIKAISLFGHHKLTMLPVLNDEKQYTGVLMSEDLLAALGILFSFNQEGAIIILEVSPYNYSLSQIAQIIESNDAKILHLFVTELVEKNNLEIIICINQAFVHRILQTFYRYNYTIKSIFSSDENTDDLQNRYGLLMRILNV